MKHIDFERHLSALPASGHVEALVSLDTRALRERSKGDYRAFVREKRRRFRHVADAISKLTSGDGKVDIYDQIDKIAVDTTVHNWSNILHFLETLEKSRKLETEVFLNETAHLIR